jgi:hypothetical protein
MESKDTDENTSILLYLSMYQLKRYLSEPEQSFGLSRNILPKRNTPLFGVVANRGNQNMSNGRKVLDK